ncbi:MAG: hypothetical protein KBD01_12735 [Acidobacteria bacterium]|nr:hypothetical protein [Acidobacteriota bacterium]
MRLSCRVVLIACLLSVLGLAAASPAGTTRPPGTPAPTLVERIDGQRRIEEVYWAHRSWPADNPGPKPALSAVLDDGAIAERAEDALRQSEALRQLGYAPITPADLQAEIDRMARETRDPATLRELWAALDDRADLVAECLARPLLAERRLRAAFAHDERVHGALRVRALAALAATRGPDDWPRAGGMYAETTFLLARGVPDPEPRRGGGVGNLTYELDASDWGELRLRLARATGELQEDEQRFFAEIALEKTDRRIRVASLTWAKLPFDEWWSEASRGIAPAIPDDAQADAAAPFSLPAISGGCTPDTWQKTRIGSPSARRSARVVWTGTEMIVWGGQTGPSGDLVTFDDGGRYNPATDSWSTVRHDGTQPSARCLHAAVWTGTEMIVWGGWASVNFNVVDDGKRYNPTTNRWTAMKHDGTQPIARDRLAYVWTGTEMIVWGGLDSTQNRTNSGARYNPQTDTWTPTKLDGTTPQARDYCGFVWTGTEMIVWGGYGNGPVLDDGGRYNPQTDTWTAMLHDGSQPSARYWHSAVWTGSEMIVWGGTLAMGAGNTNTGSRYNPTSNSWTATTLTGAPAERADHVGVWTGTEMIIWGAGNTPQTTPDTGGRYNPTANSWTPTRSDSTTPRARTHPMGCWAPQVGQLIVWGGVYNMGTDTNTGGRYTPASDSWAPTSDAAPAPAVRAYHSSVWTGAEMVIWAGANGSVYLNDGGRYDPATDGWRGMTSAIDGREGQSTVWTGTEMIVWGGWDQLQDAYHSDGARYNPTTDRWTLTSVSGNVPMARYDHSAVWTGQEMIVWGGYNGSYGYLNTGARYNPKTDAWSPTSTGTSCPGPRYVHTAVWTGTEMIVWGGYTGSGYENTGGRYTPSSNSWTATSTGTNVPEQRYGHTAVWTGTQMIVWGGYWDPYGLLYGHLNSGGRYTPATNSWAPTSTGTNTPAGRYLQTALWTGVDMLVWGGYGSAIGYTNAGGHYSASGDGWTPMSTSGDVPSGRIYHSMVWLGSADGRAIVWGGYPYTDTGALYCGLTCTVTPPSGSPTLTVAKPPGTPDASLSWTALAGATGYDAVRGDIAALLAAGGDFSGATDRCLANDQAGTTATDLGRPAAGTGLWYLVRGRNCGGTASYDEGKPGQQGHRDRTINGSGAACP